MKCRTICASITIVAAVAVLSTVTEAQSEQKIGTVEFDEPFADPDDITAKELARVEGIPLAEARNRLSLMNEASILVQKLRARYPSQFAGALAVRKAPFHINIYFAGLDPVQMNGQLASLGASARLQAVLKVGSAPTSEATARAQSRTLLKQLQSRGIAGTVAWSAIGDGYKFLVKNTAEAATAARMGYLTSGKNVRIEKFDGIRLVNDIFGGQLYDGAPYQQSAENCTIGFMVRKTGSNNYGAATAGHCVNTGHYRFEQITPSVEYEVPFQQEWNGNGADIQWHRVNSGPNNLIVPKFWNGTGLTTVTGGQGDYAGLFACKYGVTTYRTCGYVDAYQYLSVVDNVVYGDMPRINKNPSYLNMVDFGDSGGPVFTGSLAVGFTHAKDQYGNVYYMPLRAMTANALPISVICNC